MLRLKVDLGRGHEGCDPSCEPFLDFWTRFWSEHADPSAPPVAIAICKDYYDRLRPKSKAMVRQARRLYEFREFSIDAHVAAVEAINFSKHETSEGPLRGWFVAGGGGPRYGKPLCDIHRDTWYGGFDQDGVMRGYLRLIRLNKLGVIHDIFRHAEGSTAVTNGLIAHAAENGGVKHISYHTMIAVPYSGRPQFKERTGFQEARLTVRELTLA